MKEPRPFHIGTRVALSGSRATFSVLGVHRDIVVVVHQDDAFPHHVRRKVCAHASDGAPLGEWQPIAVEAELEAKKKRDEAMSASYEINSLVWHGFEQGLRRANAIIRGEGEQ